MMRRELSIAAIFASALLLITVVACGPQIETVYVPAQELPLGTPVIINEAATQAAGLTQEMNSANIEAVATAEIVRANAQATLNSANATLSAAQTQEQNNANLVAAQVAATVEIVRANAQATLVAANSTQSTALTQDALRQTQAQYDLLAMRAAANTGTAIANSIATQAQAATATSQWYADQARQSAEQRRAPITFLWIWCFPPFIVLLAGLLLWGIWRGVKILQANQERLVEDPPVPAGTAKLEIIDGQQAGSLPALDREEIDRRYQLTKPDDQVAEWLDEVKSKLQSEEMEEEDHDTGK